MSERKKLNTDRADWSLILVDYLRRMPASLQNVQSHFCLTRDEAMDVLWAARQQGLVFVNGRNQWEAVNV